MSKLGYASLQTYSVNINCIQSTLTSVFIFYNFDVTYIYASTKLDVLKIKINVFGKHLLVGSVLETEIHPSMLFAGATKKLLHLLSGQKAGVSKIV